MDCMIMPFTLADYDEVIAFWKGQEGIDLNESDEREALGRFFERNAGMSLVARNGAGEVVGAILCGHDGRRGYLHHLAVDRAWRRKGVGREMVERCLAALGAAGIPKCTIFLLDGNDAGRAFWGRMGYRAVSWSPLQRHI